MIRYFHWNQTMMKLKPKITCLFVDIGGVLLTDGWNHVSRKLAATEFKLDFDEFEIKHHQAFDTYENGKLTLDEYLNHVVFDQKRAFTSDEFQKFMFTQSKPFPRMIELVGKIKKMYGLKIIVVSNEGRELNEHRINHFKLDRFVDAFVSSCFVHMRKPDIDIFHLALDITQTPPEQIVFIDNTPMFTEIAKSLGIQCIHHTDYRSTRSKLNMFGLSDHL